ncbi:Spo0E like sporulation regulatory protein [Paenibacillus sp. 1_12]|uniref:aspartyl-phosphate phosphatase Spo0E family protein n=1 Tax=Paenibacillus sp. 1_12 TaxID=1566278 RepID=UPI0008EABB84|nr:aspartyl-phosphate phosphatase Spo0E family protein [Paenibacillus sp. 1_12]SFL32197.1 Spo0E like sporulation regulatory protein [Paenibacillus sp. 1_12]
MDRTIKQLTLIIELLRVELHHLAENKDLADPELVAASKMLDVVLNEYDRVLKRNTK